MAFFRKLGATGLALILAACTTTPDRTGGDPANTDPSNSTGSTTTQPDPVSGDNGMVETITPPPTIPDTNPVVVPPNPVLVTPPPPSISISEAYSDVLGWGLVDVTAALKSFQRGCAKLVERDDNEKLHARQEFGRISDWRSTCNTAMATPAFSDSARLFFENEFLPINMSGTGTVTGYYQPEIRASRFKTTIFSEPILKTPSDSAKLNLSRSQINETTSEVIAYGKPIEVFFMQVQGSGVLSFDTGEKVRAAYDANNGKPYTSIGRILVERGAFSLEQASKQAIEDWMDRNGAEATRALMNENARYIFFKEETILPGEGPKGAMRVPLTDMASIAVDPSYYPYGVPVWLDTTLPQVGGDYRGAREQRLVITQDTGKAIRGAFRADLYFGSGDKAGDLAGVMKHPGTWTILLPVGLALSLLPVS